MKRLIPKLFFAFALLFCTAQFSSAQICTPDPLCTGGICPTILTGLPGACVDNPYSATVTIVIPPDTTVSGQTFSIQSVIIDSIAGLPMGFVYDCEPGNCVFPGGGAYCLVISGFPMVSQVGNYPITIHTTISLTHPILPPIVTSNPLPGYDIDITAPPTVAINRTQPSCGGSNGIAICAPNGVGPFSYNWSTGDTGSTLNGLPPGTYCVDVMDANGCTDTACVILTDQPGPDIVNVNTTPNPCFENMLGTASLTLNGGTAPLTYAWSDNSSGSTATGLGTGNIIVTVTDANGCTDTDTGIVASPSPLSLSIGHSNESCAGCNDGTANAFITGGTQPYTGSWAHGPSAQSLTGLAPGTYTYSVTDSNGCTSTDSITVTVFVGIEEELTDEVKLYPNPNSGVFNLEVNFDAIRDFRVAIFDLQGRRVYNRTISGASTWQDRIDLGQLPDGLYYLRLDDGTRTANRKIIIE